MCSRDFRLTKTLPHLRAFDLRPSHPRIALVKHVIPSRTQPLSTVAPMVLHLKVWESRSSPNLIRTLCSLNDDCYFDAAHWAFFLFVEFLEVGLEFDPNLLLKEAQLHLFGYVSLFLFFALPLSLSAQTLPIDNSFTVQAHGQALEVEGQERYVFVTYTKFVNMSGKLGICGAYYGLIDRRFLGRAGVYIDEKRVRTNLSKFRILTNEKRFTEIRKNRKPGKTLLVDVTQTASIKPVDGLLANCFKTNKKIDSVDLNAPPKVRIPEKIFVRVR